MNVTLKKVSLLLLAVLSFASANGFAQQRKHTVAGGDSNIRCKNDSLDNSQAERRLAWAKRHNVIPEDQIESMIYVVRKGQAVKRDRFQYPMFGTWNGNRHQSKLWRPEDHKFPATLPSNIEWLAICTASCYTSDQQLLTANGYIPIAEAESSQVSEIMVVSKGSALGSVSTSKARVGKYTRSFRDTDHEVLNFSTSGGGTISVTKGHVLVDGQGVLKVAADFKEGDSLLTAEGEPDAITSITKEDYFGSVYNVRPQSLDYDQNLVIVQGFINGSDRFQNDWANSIGKSVLIKSIPDDLF